ncbi:MAG: glycosyltransferase [Dehalococcoidia bacterium]
MKPRILMVVDSPNWAFDFSARQIARHLADQFAFRFLYVDEQLPYAPENYDLIQVFFWGEKHHARYHPPRSKVIKEISSHRWEFEQKYRCLSPSDMAQTYLRDAASVVTTSKRLYRRFAPYVENLFHCRNGFDPSLFRYRRPRQGNLQVGWAGNPKDPQKGIVEVLRPACSGQFSMIEAASDIPHKRMGEFYNELDVYLVGSKSEGEPLTLIEAMASGCFPVCTDVGIVPELVQHGVNGLLVERSPEAFREALSWCRDNLEQVREKGLENARLMLETRRWEFVVEDWRRMFENSLARANGEVGWNPAPGSYEKTTTMPSDQPGAISARQASYRPNYARDALIDNPSWTTAGVATKLPSGASNNVGGRELAPVLEEILPKEKDSPILILGVDKSPPLTYLLNLGFSNVHLVSVTNPLNDWAHSHIRAQIAISGSPDLIAFCREHSKEFRGVFMFDVMQHFAIRERSNVFSAVLETLQPGGTVCLRTENAASPLALYSRFRNRIDSSGNTEPSLMEAFETAGFCLAQTRRCGEPGIIRRGYSRLSHLIYTISGGIIPISLEKNLLISARRPASEL